MAKQTNIMLRVDEETHDDVLRYAQRLEAVRGESISVNDVVKLLLSCADEVTAPIKMQPFKQGRGAKRRFYTAAQKTRGHTYDD